MKIRKFKEEADRLNVQVEAVNKTFEKLLSKGEIQGIIDTENEAFICYDPEEMNTLVDRLRSEQVSLKEVAEELNLKPEQVRLIVNKLLSENRVKGIFTEDDVFMSDTTMRNLVIDLVERSRKLDIFEISRELLIQPEKVEIIIGDLERKIINTVAPYRQVRFIDLSHEVELPEALTIELLKRLVSEGKIIGSLDMVNRIFMIEGTQKVPTEPKLEVPDKVSGSLANTILALSLLKIIGAIFTIAAVIIFWMILLR